MASAATSLVPVILVAAPRSGANLIQRALAAHPAIAFAPPFDFLTDTIQANGRFMKREAFVREVESSGAIERLGLIVPSGLPFAGIAQNLLGQIASAKPGASITGITLQRDVDRALWLWPDARFIHFVRDGRDVAMAEVAAGWSGNMWHGIANWVAVETLWERMANKLPADRRFTITFETLMTDPQAEMQRLCAFLGVAFDPVMMKPFETPLSRGGGWRKAAPAELSAAEYAAARGLLQGGYLLSGTVKKPSLLRRALLRANRRFAISRKRRRLLGFQGWLTNALGDLFRSDKTRERRIRRNSETLDRDEEWG